MYIFKALLNVNKVCNNEYNMKIIFKDQGI